MPNSTYRLTMSILMGPLRVLEQAQSPIKKDLVMISVVL